MTIRTQWHIIGRGLNGWHAAGLTDLGQRDGTPPTSTTTSSGGDLLPYKYWAGQDCPGYAAEALEGAPIYDASEADPDAFARFVIRGPMVSAALDPEGGRDNAGGLEYVGAARYIRLLRAAVPGVRFGHVEAGQPVWDEATR